MPNGLPLLIFRPPSPELLLLPSLTSPSSRPCCPFSLPDLLLATSLLAASVALRLFTMGLPAVGLLDSVHAWKPEDYLWVLSIEQRTRHVFMLSRYILAE